MPPSKKKLSKVYSLTTNATQMTFVERNGLWSLAYYGARVASAADAANLGLARLSPDSHGECAFDAYPVYGADRGEHMNKRGAMAVRHADGDMSLQLMCREARLEADARGVSHLVFDWADKVHPFFLRQHFRAVRSCDVVETWVEVSHTEDAPVELSRMASFGLEATGVADEFHVLSLSGQWGTEANVSECELMRGQEIVLGTRSGVRGAWENNPAFMLSIGPRADEEHGRVIAGALAWSGAWNISLGHSAGHELRIYAGVANPSGPYVLDPGKTLVLPKVMLTYSDAGKGVASRNLHRWAREWRMPHGKALRDILLNSWEGAWMTFTEKTLTDMMDGVKELGGELFVIDDGWFGRGEFARNDDTRGLGDWCWNFEKLPHGLNHLVKEAKKRGLKLGLWFEPEMANTKSEIVTKHPDWVVREAGRPLRTGRGGTQVVLDLANPAVRDAIFRQIDAVIKSAKGLAYIKWDSNADFHNVGSRYLDARHQANIWFDFEAGAFALFERIRKAHPEIVFQACSSGGGHVDYGWLGYSDEFWGSDDTCAQQRVFIQWGEGLFYPSGCIGSHVTVSPNLQTGREAPLKYRIDVAMSGRFGFELHPVSMKPEEIETMKRAVVTYKRIRPVVQQGDLYRLVSPYERDYSALMFVSRDRRHAVAMVYGRDRLCMQGRVSPLSLRGLDPTLRYAVAELDTVEGKSHAKAVDGKTVGGDALLSVGVPFSLGNECDSFILEFTAV